MMQCVKLWPNINIWPKQITFTDNLHLVVINSRIYSPELLTNSKSFFFELFQLPRRWCRFSKPVETVGLHFIPHYTRCKLGLPFSDMVSVSHVHRSIMFLHAISKTGGRPRSIGIEVSVISPLRIFPNARLYIRDELIEGKGHCCNLIASSKILVFIKRCYL